MATPNAIVEGWRNDIKSAVVSAAAAASRELVAAVAGKEIWVLGGFVSLSAGGSVTFHSDTTDLTGDLALATGIPLSLPLSECGYMHTASGEALKATPTTGNLVGVLRYVEV